MPIHDIIANLQPNVRYDHGAAYEEFRQVFMPHR